MTSGIKAILLVTILCIPLTLSADESRITSPTDGIKLDVPLGTWIYGVWLGKNRVGTANTTTSFAEGMYTSTVEMTVKLDATIVTTTEITKETITYNPVSYFCSTTVILKDKVTRELVTVDFQKDIAHLKRGDETKTITLNDNFIISGNKFTAELLKSKFLKNTELKAFVYDPSFDEDALISVSEKVIGKEMVNLPKEKIELTHLVETLGPVKSIQNYVDAQGTVYKTSISMLNSTIDLILESRGVEKKK